MKLPDVQIEDLKEKLDIDAASVPYLEQLVTSDVTFESESDFLLPENFWFYHNGISIYSYEEVLETPTNQIVLTPDMVSVINGAQTLTNFFLEVENVEMLLEDIFKGVIQSSSVHTVVDSITRSIYVKTIIICGDDKFVRPITHGLNTQIPIFEESLLADSNLSDEINKKLAIKGSKLRIIKDGQSWSIDYGVNVVDFVKHWLTVQCKPGRSKNLAKRQLKESLEKIQKELDASNIKQMEQLIQVYKWWDSAYDQRVMVRAEDKTAVTIGKYGRNYFGSYVMFTMEQADNDVCLDDTFLAILYERFVKELKSAGEAAGIEIALGTFKQDDLADKVFSTSDKYKKEKKTTKSAFPPTITEDLRELLNQDGQSAYSFSKTIADYLLAHDIVVDYFRVISRTGEKCKEAFPFPNSTFMEIADNFSLEELCDVGVSDGANTDTGPKTISYSESAFAKAVEKVFPVFVVEKNVEGSKHKVSQIHFIKEFSFKKFAEDAKKIFEQTIEAFRTGDESSFPRSGDGCHFHVRPKAINAEDTFQFTNGNLITKRTFWANKDTVEELIAEELKSIN